MENVKPAPPAALQRLQHGYRLQRRYALGSEDIASLLGISVPAYHRRLKKAGLIKTDLEHSPPVLVTMDIDDILVKINGELQRFSQSEGLPDKAAVDALAALAKAIKSISELSKETRPDHKTDEREGSIDNGGVKPEDVREALSLINRKIIELSARNG